MDQILPLTYILYDLQAKKKKKNILKSWGKKSKEESYVMAQKLYEIQILVSITKIVLEHSYTHSSTYHLW